MQFLSRLSTKIDVPGIVEQLTKDTAGRFDLGFLFAASMDRSATLAIAAAIREKVDVKNLLGCSCAGIIGTDQEIERQPGCSLFLGSFDQVNLNPFYVNQDTLDQLTSKESWYEYLDVYPNEKPKFLILPDPYLLDVNQFIEHLNAAYPYCPVIGGLASGSLETRGNTLILNDRHFEEGLVGVSLTGHVRLETVVSQGCRPIGEPFIVTKAKGNVIFELAGRPFHQVLEEILNKASIGDKALAQEAIFIGIAMNEYKHAFSRGDFLVRMLIGLDQQSGAGVITDYIQSGQTIQFHVRDAVSSTEDLSELLGRRQNEAVRPALQGALVFSCNGRGENLFREKNHDIQIIQKLIGPVPAAGFFCAGEIGPVGGKNFIHGLTSSLALFYP